MTYYVWYDLASLCGMNFRMNRAIYIWKKMFHISNLRLNLDTFKKIHHRIETRRLVETCSLFISAQLKPMRAAVH